MVTVTNHNLTACTDGNPILGLLNCTTEATNYYPGILLFFTIYIILFLALTFRGTKMIASISVCNFVGFFLSLIFFALGILPGIYLVIMIIVLALSVFLLFFV